MARSIISYDMDLPEIRGRRPWEPPTSYLVKDKGAPTGWREDKSGRRPSELLLVPKLRTAVDEWRAQGYPGASDVTQRLFEYWFEEDHEVPGFGVPFRYYFCQREAIETLVYLIEIVGNHDAEDLIRRYAEVRRTGLLPEQVSVVFQTTMDGQRQIRRFVEDRGTYGVQDLPPPNLRRYAFKMATGSGKTWVMAMVAVWAHFHKKRVRGSDLSTNFLIVAPNVIVYQRLEKDFASNRIFHELPLIPPEWRGAWSQKPILRGESTEPDAGGNLFLTNIQQLYQARDREKVIANPVERILGPKPVKDLASQQRSMLQRLQGLPDLIVINDEAHHVHDPDLEWSQSLLAIHEALPKGLSLWLDFSATPKDQQGMYFPWTVVDYPLAQAVEDRIVKAPIIVTKENDPKRPRWEPENITKKNVTDKYGYWIRAAVQRWKEHYEVYKKLGTRPVLFIMAEKNVYADAIGDYLWQTKEFGLRESEVLVIHTDTKGEITKADLEKARQAAREIDQKSSKVKAIVSVMMLREGWDVRNVSVVLGLRPFTAKAEILPEQVIGRGLRLMTVGEVDRMQTLEVLGTQKLLNVLREQLEVEGVGVATTADPPPPPVTIEAVRSRLGYDIAIPLTKPRLTHNVRKLSELDPSTWGPIYDQEELPEAERITLKMEFAITKSEVGQVVIAPGEPPAEQELLGAITNEVIRRARLTGAFAELYPLVRSYVLTRCFGRPVELNNHIRSHLWKWEVREGLAAFLARKVAEVTVEKRALEFERADFRLSETRPFVWRRNLPPLEAKRTVFNYVATYNPFERAFAKFLDEAPDVLRFASLGTTEQGESGTQFRVDYLKPSGAIGFYHPDWVVVQQTEQGEAYWIVETKGRVWEGTEAKDAAMQDWCQRVHEQTGQHWQFARVNQGEFEQARPRTFADAVQPTVGIGLPL